MRVSEIRVKRIRANQGLGVQCLTKENCRSMKSQVLLQKLLWPYCLCPWKIRQKIEMSLVAHLSRAENWPFFTKIGRTYTIICLSGLSERNSAPRILISRKFHFLHHHVRFLIYFFRNLAPNSLVISKVLASNLRSKWIIKFSASDCFPILLTVWTI